MKGEKILKILGAVAENTGWLICDLARVFIDPYHASLRRERYQSKNKPGSLRKFFDAIDAKKKERVAFSQTIYFLKRDGLIAEQQGKFSLTGLGFAKLKQLQQRRATAMPEPKYEQAPTNELKIVMFDIPEKIAQKRFWLRSALKNLNYRMLQKSVWAGKTKIPESFMNDARTLGLLPHIQILAVTKTGSLRSIA